MTRLSFISDEDLERAIKNVVTSVRKKTSNIEKTFNKNIIDPFSTLFEIACTSIDEASWKKSEEIRQIQKNLSNSIGNFHQVILGSIYGWEVVPAGGSIDIINRSKKIIAEIKNKYNTLNALGQKATYEGLQEQVMQKNNQYKDYTAYLVEIVPKKAIRYNTAFIPSDKSTGIKFPENSLIRKIDGYSFYALASGVEDALEQLFEEIPNIISSFSSEPILNSEFVKKLFRSCYFE